MEAVEVSFDQVFNLAQRLSLVDKIKMIARLGPAGALADLGPAPSSEDIDEIRREMCGNFPREDI